MSTIARRHEWPWTAPLVVMIGLTLSLPDGAAFSAPPPGDGQADPAGRPARYILEPVGPGVIFDQTDQDCAGSFYVDTYASLLGFLRDYYPPLDFCYSDGTEPTPEFVATGQAHLYWLDQVPGDGNLINGVDLKYFTDTVGPNVVLVHFREQVSLPDGNIGSAIHPPDTYRMIVPGTAHAGEPYGNTYYFIRMSLPSDKDIAAGAKPGYFVGELLDPHLPADLSYSNIVPGTGVEFWMPAWRPVVALAGDQFGVAMSLNEGWLDDGVSADDPTMGLWLASHDDSDPDPLFDWFAPLDHFEQAFIDCDSGAPLPLLGYGGANCSPPDPTPEASIYMKLWYKFEDCNHNGIPDDQDIAWGTSVDCNGNGIPDECEPGDIDGDGDVDLSDFATFALCYAGAGVTVPPPSCSEAWFCSSDLDGDDDVDLSDFAIFALNYTG